MPGLSRNMRSHSLLPDADELHARLDRLPPPRTGKDNLDRTMCFASDEGEIQLGQFAARVMGRGWKATYTHKVLCEHEQGKSAAISC